MSTPIKARSDLKFEETNFPKPIKFDFAREVTDEDMQAMTNAMAKRAGMSPEELKEHLSGGILVSGEDW